MLQWSKYFQSPIYLDLYRKMIMDSDYKALFTKWLKLRNGIKVLDVGCGTGAFSFYLSTEVFDSIFYGIDIDPLFVECANKKVNSINNNTFHFQVGDALALPFSDEEFDLVISYTVLTNLPNGHKAMQEMRRVTKKDGLIASVTAQSFAFQPRYMGNYPSSHRYIHEYRSMHSYISGLYERIQPSMDYLQYGTDPLNIPSLFAQSNLRNIEMHPIGCAFSLSNSTLTLDEKKQIIELEYMAERNKFEEFYKLPTFAQYISNEDAMRYLDLLLSRKNMLLCNLNDNSIWEWFGGAQILMIGQK